jgi:hypothetical protein
MSLLFSEAAKHDASPCPYSNAGRESLEHFSNACAVFSGMQGVFFFHSGDEGLSPGARFS